jgi:glycosyltransferase involved in cell wall biosynthesis
MKRRLTFAISADYERRTGGWVYDQRLLAELERLGWEVERLLLPAGFPHPDETARARTGALLRDLPDGSVLLVDQLCLGVLPDLARVEADRLRLVIIVHHPLGLEGDPEAPASLAWIASERETLRHVRLAVATSDATAALLRDRFAVDNRRLAVARPGVDALPRSPGSAPPPLQLLSVGAVVPRKDHVRLISALATLADRPWRLQVVGNITRAGEHVASLRQLVGELGLDQRVELSGELDDQAIEAAWARADLFVAASRLEGFGMAAAEAIARGLPVVTTAAGAVGQWIDRGAALVVDEPGAAGLATALARVMDEPGLRDSLREGARLAAARLPRWSDAARIVAQAIEEVCQ